MHQQSIDTPRLLAVDAVQKGRSVHPGAPMGAPTLAYTRRDRFLEHIPRSPTWPNRDPFILAAAHSSPLVYAPLHLTRYELPLEELKSFRQWGSKTAGHPECRLTPGGVLCEQLGIAADNAIAHVKRLLAG